jgi:hypothetical protein
MVQLIIIVDLFIYVQAQITLSPFYYFNFLNTFKYIYPVIDYNRFQYFLKPVTASVGPITSRLYTPSLWQFWWKFAKKSTAKYWWLSIAWKSHLSLSLSLSLSQRSHFPCFYFLIWETPLLHTYIKPTPLLAMSLN